MSAVRIAARRLAGWVATVLGAATLTLLLVHLAPGDAIDAIPGGEALRPVLAAEWGLDRPLPLRVGDGLLRLARGDLGTSVAYRPGAPVAEVIAGPALRSMGWLVGGQALALAGALGLAWWTSSRAAPRLTLAVRLVSVAPVFLLAHLAVHGANAATFALIEAGAIGRPAWFALPDQPSAARAALAMTLLAVGSGTLTELHLELDGALRRLRASGFVDAARARGLPTGPHLWANLVPELASIAAARVAFLVGSLVILERVLLLPGAGTVLWRAAEARDTPVAVGVAVCAAAVVATARGAADLARLAIDPRLRALEGR